MALAAFGQAFVLHPESVPFNLIRDHLSTTIWSFAVSPICSVGKRFHVLKDAGVDALSRSET